MQKRVLKGKKPLEVVGWLGSEGYQTIIIKPTKTKPKDVRKLVGARPTPKPKAKARP